MNEACIILYRLPPGTPHTTVNKFCKKFYGQDTSSHHGKYRYHLHGILDDIPHKRLIRQTLIVRVQDIDPIIEFLNEYSAEIHIRMIKPTREDRKTLELPLE